MVLVFGGQRVVDVEGVILLGRGLHRVLQLVLGIRIILPNEGWRRRGGDKVQLEPKKEQSVSCVIAS